MNHIARITAERDELQTQLREVREMLTDALQYYGSAKFHGPENNYAHVSTDLWPRLLAIQFATIQN